MHLFFNCTYSQELWTEVSLFYFLTPFNDSLKIFININFTSIKAWILICFVLNSSFSSTPCQTLCFSFSNERCRQAPCRRPLCPGRWSGSAALGRPGRPSLPSKSRGPPQTASSASAAAPSAGGAKLTTVLYAAPWTPHTGSLSASQVKVWV